LEQHSALASTEVRKVAPFFRVAMPKETDRKKVCKVLSELQTNVEMTYAEAQDEFLMAFPNFRKRDPVSPRKLESMLAHLCLAIEDFEVTSIDTAQRRAKASRRELRKATTKLAEVLQSLLDQLGDTKE
jgi:hypothetical protein